MTVNGGTVVLDLLTVSQSSDYLALNHVTGKLILSTAKIEGNRAAAPIAVSLAGSIETNFTSFTNTGGGKALVVTNAAMLSTPNKLCDTFHTGGIDCNTSVTVVEGVVGGNPTSSIADDPNLIYRGGTQLKNDSTIIKDESGGTLIGKTMNDSIDRVAQVTQYDPDHGFMLVEPCIDDI